MLATSFQTVLFTARLLAGLCEGASLSLFAFVIAKVFDARFPATEPGLTLLPALALSCAILWNIAAMLTISRLRATVHAIGDVAIAALLVVLGGVGFAHDDINYLSNGMWQDYDDNNWLVTEVTGGILMLISFIAQLLLALLSWHQSGYEKQDMQRKVAAISYRNDEARNVKKEEPSIKQEQPIDEEAGGNLLNTGYKTLVDSKFEEKE